MAIKDQAYWQKRQEKLQIENREVRGRLASLKKDYKKIERILRTQNYFFDAMPAGILLIQLEKIVAINETALTQLGYQLEECLGRAFLDFVHPKMVGAVKKLHKDRLAGKWVPSQYEVDLVAKNGRTHECDVRVKKVRFKGRKAFIFLMSRQEKRKKKEQELIRTQKMEAFRTMASGLNRQINRNLGMINESIRGMRERGIPESPNITDRLKEIEEATERIAKTTLKLDVLARRENDQSSVLSFDLNKVVRDVTLLIEPKLKDESERRGVSLGLKTYQRSFSPLRGNPEEIRDVILNMIINGVDAMPGGGDIYLSTEENGGYAYIYVQDSGEGIAERINGRILDPFFTTKGEGCIGLGLSLSYAIVKRHGGDIEVKSKKGQGTIVTIRLPVEREESEEKQVSRRVRVKNAHILIIEGHHMLRELLSQVLGNKGFKTEKANDPLEGLNLLRKRPFDLVVADTSDPALSTAKLVKRVKKIDNALPVVLISSNERNGDKHRSLDGIGADLIVRKPLDMEQFASHVLDVLVRNS